MSLEVTGPLQSALRPSPPFLLHFLFSVEQVSVASLLLHLPSRLALEPHVISTSEPVSFLSPPLAAPPPPSSTLHSTSQAFDNVRLLHVPAWLAQVADPPPEPPAVVSRRLQAGSLVRAPPAAPVVVRLPLDLVPARAGQPARLAALASPAQQDRRLPRLPLCHCLRHRQPRLRGSLAAKATERAAGWPCAGDARSAYRPSNVRRRRAVEDDDGLRSVSHNPPTRTNAQFTRSTVSL